VGVWEHPGAELGRVFFASLAVGTLGDQPPSGVVGGGLRVATRRCPRRCGAGLCPWPGCGGRFFPARREQYVLPCYGVRLSRERARRLLVRCYELGQASVLVFQIFMGVASWGWGVPSDNNSII
jgi:hypothetical protein